MAATTPASTAPPTLSFPPQTFAKLRPHEFLHANLTSSPSQPTRPSGRSPTEFRQPTAHTSSLTHCSGSAVVRVGDTAVVCGVRAEILKASDVPHYHVSGTGRDVLESSENSAQHHISALGLLVPNIELSTGCSPAHLPGNPPGTLAQSLTQRILNLLYTSKIVDGKQLRLWYTPPATSSDENMDIEDDVEEQQPVIKAFWALYIDILFISLSGNPFDAAWAAVVLALGDTKLPRAWWDIDREMVICSDLTSEASKLTLRNFPIASTFSIFSTGKEEVRDKEARKFILADPDTFEEQQCQESVTVTVDCSGPRSTPKLIKIEKSGGSVVGVSEMKDLVKMAKGRWDDYNTLARSLKG